MPGGSNLAILIFSTFFFPFLTFLKLQLIFFMKSRSLDCLVAKGLFSIEERGWVNLDCFSWLWSNYRGCLVGERYLLVFVSYPHFGWLLSQFSLRICSEFLLWVWLSIPLQPFKKIHFIWLKTREHLVENAHIIMLERIHSKPLHAPTYDVSSVGLYD